LNATEARDTPLFPFCQRKSVPAEETDKGLPVFVPTRVKRRVNGCHKGREKWKIPRFSAPFLLTNRKPPSISEPVTEFKRKAGNPKERFYS
jgi:hypothetical protein